MASDLAFQNRFNLEGVVIASDLIKKRINLLIESEEFYHYLSSKINIDRMGEVVFAIEENNKIWLVRQSEYPEGIYRVPSGGIGLREPVASALIREIKEELAIEAIDYKLIGVIEYELSYKHTSFEFYSFVFLVEKFLKDENLKTDGEISEVLSTPIEKTEEYFKLLLNQHGFWGDWGRLRYYSSNIVWEYLSGQVI